MFFLALIILVCACNARVNETTQSILTPPNANRRARPRPRAAMHSGWYAVGPTWKRYEPLSDEFDGLNRGKWQLDAGPWKGRQPGRFSKDLVKVNGGSLKLFADHGYISPADMKQGYKNWRTSYVTSKGLFPIVAFSEIRARSGSSKISSSWWFHHKTDTPNGLWRTEIDVVESSGRKNQRPDLYGNMFSHLHVWNLPKFTNPWALQQKCGCKVNTKSGKPPYSCAIPNWKNIVGSLSDRFNTFGLLRTRSRIKFFLNTKLVWDMPNLCFFQPLNMIFDRETMFHWLESPMWGDVPDTPYEIQYVRTWTP